MTFLYQGYSADGSRRSGRIEAGDEADAVRALLAEGIYARGVKSVAAGGGGGRLDPARRAVLWRELGALLGAGMPLDQALELMRQSEGAIAGVLEKIAAGICGGASLSASLESVGADAFERAAISSAEASATLPQTLARLADELDARQEARSRIRAALAYPSFVLVLGLIVAAGMLGLVVPRATDMMRASGMELPAASRALVAFARSVAVLAVPLAVVAALFFVAAFARIRRGDAVAEALDRFLLRLPLLRLGGVVAAQRFASVLSALGSGGMPVADALPLAAAAMNRPALARPALEAAGRVRAGESLSVALRAIPCVGGELARWAAVGEGAGCLPQMLSVAAGRFKARWERSLSLRLAMLEPAMLAAVGLFVFVLALALLLPVLSLANGAAAF